MAALTDKVTGLDVKQQVALLKSVDIFSGLTDRQLRMVAQALKVMRFSAGAELTHEGDTDSRFYLIVEGTVKVSVKGRKRAELGPGKYLGEISVIDGQPRSATAVALTDVVALSAAAWNLETVLKKNPTVALSILREMCRRLRSLEKSLTD